MKPLLNKAAYNSVSESASGWCAEYFLQKHDFPAIFFYAAIQGNDKGCHCASEGSQPAWAILWRLLKQC